MKNFLLPLFITLLLVSCNTEEIADDAIIQESGDALLQGAKSGAGSSADNPIVVTAKYVDLVSYTITTCDSDNQQTREVGRIRRLRGFFYLPYRANINGQALYKETDVESCFVEVRDVLFEDPEYKFGTYYKIYGEVVRLGRPLSYSSYWFRDVPNSNQVQRVTFSEDGSKTYSEPFDFPYEENLDCTGVQPLPNNFAGVPSGTLGTLEADNQTFLYEYDGTANIKFRGPCGKVGPDPDAVTYYPGQILVPNPKVDDFGRSTSWLIVYTCNSQKAVGWVEWAQNAKWSHLETYPEFRDAINKTGNCSVTRFYIRTHL